MFCFGLSMKGVIANDIDMFFEKRANDIIEQADAKRSIIKLVFSAETDAEELNELEKTSLYVNIAEKLADYNYCQKESIQAKDNTSWAHTFTLKIIIKNGTEKN